MSAATPTISSDARRGLTEQTRRRGSSVNSGQAERLLDIAIGGGLVLAGLRRPFSVAGAALIAGGGVFLYAAATGHFKPYAALGLVRNEQRSGAGLIVERSITIGAPPDTVYAYWRDFARLPTFMRHLDAVTTTDGAHSHWVARAPLGRTVEWDAQITEDRPNELIAWESLPGTLVPNQGEVRFSAAPGGRGTELTVRMTYQPPLGAAGAAVARILLEEPTLQVREDLRRLKAILETGETPTVENQPRGKLIIGKGREVALPGR
ncbi:MAG TPA: SRPBCC family protein [Ktedonobacterales bacterium]|nr:SRPBCC family protein [Ktedonobacterales bacterium]